MSDTGTPRSHRAQPSASTNAGVAFPVPAVAVALLTLLAAPSTLSCVFYFSVSSRLRFVFGALYHNYLTRTATVQRPAVAGDARARHAVLRSPRPIPGMASV